MESKCTLCCRSDRSAIDRALASGESRRAVAARFGLSEGAVGRHRKHVVMRPSRAAEATRETEAVGRSEIAGMKARTADAAQRAREKGDIRAELLAEKERRQALELELRLQQNERSDAELTSHPAWQLFLKNLLGIVGECGRCKPAILACTPSGPAHAAEASP